MRIDLKLTLRDLLLPIPTNLVLTLCELLLPIPTKLDLTLCDLLFLIQANLDFTLRDLLLPSSTWTLLCSTYSLCYQALIGIYILSSFNDSRAENLGAECSRQIMCQ